MRSKKKHRDREEAGSKGAVGARSPKVPCREESRTSVPVCDDTLDVNVSSTIWTPEFDQDKSSGSILDSQ